MILPFVLWLAAPAASPQWPQVQAVIEHYLGRPYVWGATGVRSFDCSGFVWRVMFENGVLLKRTTARKLYFCLPKVKPEERWKAGNLVFFDDLKHVGIVNGPGDFYHAESHVGTNLSRFDPYWRKKVTGVRAMPKAGP